MDRQEIVETLNRALTTMVLLKEPNYKAHMQGKEGDPRLEKAFLDLRSEFMDLCARLCGDDSSFRITVPFAVWPASNACVRRIEGWDGGFSEWASVTGLTVYDSSTGQALNGFGILPVAAVVAVAVCVSIGVAGLSYLGSDLSSIYKMRTLTATGEKLIAECRLSGAKDCEDRVARVLDSIGAGSQSSGGVGDAVSRITTTLVIGGVVLAGLFVAVKLVGDKK